VPKPDLAVVAGVLIAAGTPTATAIRRHDRLGGLIHEYSIAA
jgi:hypothetical protein